MNNFKNHILCYKMEVASLFNTGLVSGGEQKVFRLYFSGINQREAETLMKSCCNDFVIRKYQKWFLCYHLCM